MSKDYRIIEELVGIYDSSGQAKRENFEKPKNKSKTITIHLLNNSSFDTECDKDNIAYLVIDKKLYLFFNTEEDLAEFVTAVGELEISTDVFKADKDRQQEFNYEERP